MGGILVGVLAAVRLNASDSGLNYCGLTGMSSAGAVYAGVFLEYKGESRNWQDRSDQRPKPRRSCRRLRSFDLVFKIQIKRSQPSAAPTGELQAKKNRPITLGRFFMLRI
jgi:hypothetical protein